MNTMSQYYAATSAVRLAEVRGSVKPVTGLKKACEEVGQRPAKRLFTQPDYKGEGLVRPTHWSPRSDCQGFYLRLVPGACSARREAGRGRGGEGCSETRGRSRRSHSRQ